MGSTVPQKMPCNPAHSNSSEVRLVSVYKSINARHVLWLPPPPTPPPHPPTSHKAQTSVKAQHPLEEYPKTIYLREKSDVPRDYINAQLALFWQYQNLPIPYRSMWPSMAQCIQIRTLMAQHVQTLKAQCPDPNPNGPKCPNPNASNGPVSKP